MVTLAIWGEVTSGANLTICGVWGDMVDLITCAIFRDSRSRGVGVVRGVSLPSPIDLTRRPYYRVTVTPCNLSLMSINVLNKDDYISKVYYLPTNLRAKFGGILSA